MELERKIYSKFLIWKKEFAGKKALLIEGARRIGKSTIVEAFGKKEYKSYILIDFNKASKKIRDNFENINNLDLFFQTLSLEYNTKLFPVRASLFLMKFRNSRVQEKPLNILFRTVAMIIWKQDPSFLSKKMLKT